MKTLGLIFMLFACDAIFAFSPDSGFPDSALSNHGWGDSDSSAQLDSTQLLPSQKEVTTQDEIVYALPAVFIAPAGSDAQVYLDASLKAAEDFHQRWLASLPEQDLRAKCELIQHQKASECSFVDQEFLNEFARRHPEGLARAGSKRRLSFSRSAIDDACFGLHDVQKGVFERFKTTDIDACLACLADENFAFQNRFLLELMPAEEFSILVAAQVENDRLRKALEEKKELDAQDSQEGARLGVKGNRLISDFYRRSLVPYPVSESQAPRELK